MTLLLLACLCAGPDGEYERGLDLARSGRPAEARQALLEGQRNSPADKRFPLELAGLAFRDRDFPSARRFLHQALRLDPRDAYGNDFLGTLYFLEDNLDAALKYWNRLGKPFVHDVRFDPEPRLNPVLRDRLPSFSPGGMLSTEEVRAARARLEALGVFRRSRIELLATPDERYEVTIRTVERPRWNNPAALLRGLPLQTIHLDLINRRGSAVNWTSLVRWDAQKRRVATTLDAPLGRNPDRRFSLWMDGRREVWNTGSSEDFRLAREEVGADLRLLSGALLDWRTGLRVSRRRFSNAPGLAGGTSLGYQASLRSRWLAVPERRFEADSAVQWELGRMFSAGRDLYARFQSSTTAHWFPRSRGSDYAMTLRWSAGKMTGRGAPFDELFLLGVERDNNLWLRGHAGTRKGKKGSAPLGRGYLLWNWEIDKEVYRHDLLTVAAGPLVDAGRMFGGWKRQEPAGWLVDPGVQLKVRVLGAWTAAFSYARDLRSGSGVFYAAFLP
jgi:hypothetical protein